MKIRKATFRNNQAWLSIEADGEYIGTWHIVNILFVAQLKSQDLDKFKIKFVSELEDD